MKTLATTGYQIICGVLDSRETGLLRAESDRLERLHPDSPHGIRDLLARSPLIKALASSVQIMGLLLEGLRPVRAIHFDKLPGANWKVPWHQDLTIAVSERRDVEGYGPWSVKDGIVHVQPPVSVLEAMVTVRIHLDRTDQANGALRVIAGSHLHDRLSNEQIQRLREEASEVVCEVDAGDILLMKPLLLHASSESADPDHRRVIHIEYADPASLDPRLGWHELSRT